MVVLKVVKIVVQVVAVVKVVVVVEVVEVVVVVVVVGPGPDTHPCGQGRPAHGAGSGHQVLQCLSGGRGGGGGRRGLQHTHQR